jgi:hypothetical protein
MSLDSYYREQSPLFSLLNLDLRQKRVLLDWLNKLPKHEPDETATREGRAFHITFYETGIGEVLTVSTILSGGISVVHLAYDDDGNVVGETS